MKPDDWNTRARPDAPAVEGLAREAAAKIVLVNNFGLEHMGSVIASVFSKAAPVPAVGDSITFSALVDVLERLRSKHKTPSDWYEGWNAAIDCLLHDARSRSSGVAVEAGEWQLIETAPKRRN